MANGTARYSAGSFDLNVERPLRCFDIRGGVDHHGRETLVNKHDQAMQVLLILRRRLLDRMASIITENSSTLLTGNALLNNPLAANADLREILRNLQELDVAIDGMASRIRDDLSEPAPAIQSAPVVQPAPAGPPAPSAPPPRADPFGEFKQLVANQRLESAAHELARILHMSRDRVMTATRFFSRALKADPCIADRLSNLCDHAGNGSEAECLRTLIRTFGFQAVESRMAMEALRAKTQPTRDSAIPV